jgi:predicted O-linked N-acetylglucosamine transferase (SPINDLY family)
VCVCIQEYIGTVGADYIQYMITDPVASPRKYERFYSEKFIWLPSSFLATSMAYLEPDMPPPRAEPPLSPGRLGCGGEPAAFVYCNFNKQLKFDPHVFGEWLRILRAVPGSVLCLLENPADSVPFIRRFVGEADPRLVSRVRFQGRLEGEGGRGGGREGGREGERGGEGGREGGRERGREGERGGNTIYIIYVIDR